MKIRYKNFDLNESVALKCDLKTDGGEIIPAGTIVKIVSITPTIYGKNGQYFFNCLTENEKRIRPYFHQVAKLNKK